ncbi:DUF1289 domain-containing protein [Sphingomonas sp. 1P06PA]|uniref:DUF1289 domain-containing protein n=1 Tax=Sphingomonas sp. 1P06PA TaxID=554121 RepID=UPI0039A4D6BB
MAVASPCTGVCRLDDAARLCLGCARTLDEIARWSSTDDEDRAAILARIRTLPPASPNSSSRN